MMGTTNKGKAATTVLAADLPELLGGVTEDVEVLSLDCFDTILWRRTEEPTDVFYDVQRTEPFAGRRFSAKLRRTAESEARDLKRLRTGKSEVTLEEIYRAAFPSLSAEDVATISEAELAAECEACYAFPGIVDLVRNAKASGKRVIVVSDTYFLRVQLERLLRACVPEDVVNAIDRVYCSCEYGESKAAGLFRHVKKDLNLPPKKILHVGDNPGADLYPAELEGLQARHLIQNHVSVDELRRLTGSVVSVLCPEVRDSRSLPSPFHGVFAANPHSDEPDFRLGYLAAGPLLYGFGCFILAELEALEREGKKPKALFLLRDAHLPHQVCEALLGRDPGARVAISRFAALASSFREAADVESYLAKFGGSVRFNDMAKQLQLSKATTVRVVKRARKSKDSAREFARQVLMPGVVKEVVSGSKAYRQRLYRYLQKVAAVEPGDTLVFVDLGYEGTAQRRLQQVFEDELGVTVTGRYLIASRIPDWERTRKGFLDPSWCDDRALNTLVPFIALLEDLCTSDDASVVDYDEDGNPIGGAKVIAREQYERIVPIQEHCVRFSRDAKRFFATTCTQSPMSDLRTAGLGSLGRLLFMLTEPEMRFLEGFELDMNLATIDTFELFDRAEGLRGLRRRGMFFMEFNLESLRTNYPIELRSAGLELSLTMLSQLRYSLRFTRSDFGSRTEPITLLLSRDDDDSFTQLNAYTTHDGYFAIVAPVGSGDINLGIMFAKRYKWLQIESVELISTHALYQDNESQFTEDAASVASVQGILDHDNGLYHCPDETGFLLVQPKVQATNAGNYVCRVVFRPLVYRKSNKSRETPDGGADSLPNDLHLPPEAAE